jgi:hypothetical protein
MKSCIVACAVITLFFLHATAGCYPSNFTTTRRLDDPEVIRVAERDYVLAREIPCSGRIGGMLRPVEATDTNSGRELVVLKVGTIMRLHEVKYFHEIVNPKVVIYFRVGRDGETGLLESDPTSSVKLWSYNVANQLELSPEYFRPSTQ